MAATVLAGADVKPAADPRLDFVFKWLFATERNRDLLIDLLNAVLAPPPESRVVDVELANPFSLQHTKEEKLTIVDVWAKDRTGRIFLVEMQMELRAFLDERFLFYWSEAYHQQLSEGQRYADLRPVVLIVFLNQPLHSEDKPYHLRFRIQDAAHGVVFCEDLEVHTIELSKLRTPVDQIVEPLERWTWFLRNARTIDSDAIPETLAAPPIIRAMEELIMITQAERDRFQAIEEKMRRLDANQEAYEKAQREEELRKERERALVEGRTQGRAEGRAEGRAAGHAEERAAALIHRIRFSQSLLGLAKSTDDDLRDRPLEELLQLAESLEQQVRDKLLPHQP